MKFNAFVNSTNIYNYTFANIPGYGSNTFAIDIDKTGVCNITAGQDTIIYLQQVSNNVPTVNVNITSMKVTFTGYSVSQTQSIIIS